jgi:ABC-type multidrug transport system fused ATPase/permease subunit
VHNHIFLRIDTRSKRHEKVSQFKGAKKMGDFRYLLNRAWKLSKRLYVIIAVKSIFSASVPLIGFVGLGMVIDALVTGQAYEKILALLGLFTGLTLIMQLFEAFLNWRHDIEARIVSNGIAFDFIMDNLYIDYHYVQDNSLETRRQRSMGLDPGWFVMLLGNLLQYIVQFAGILTIIVSFGPPFLMVLAFSSTLLILLTFMRQKNEFQLRDSQVTDNRKLEYLFQVMSDYSYAKEVRLNQAGQYIENKYTGILTHQIQKVKHFFKKALLYNISGSLLSLSQTVAMYLYFTYLVCTGATSIAKYTVLLGAATMTNSVCLAFFNNIAEIKQKCSYAKLHREYQDMVKKNTVITVSNARKERDIDFSQAQFTFDHVSFRYPNSEGLVLKNIHLTIHRGERIGIVGLNGSGKTTFVKLLTRIYDPTEGAILVNGVDIREIPYQQYSQQIAVVLQDFFLFAYSVKENITYDQPYDRERLVASIEKSGLASKIEALENGVDTSVYKELDDTGIEFSGGEGQKLALARAIYKDAQLLIMDEPTSGLDPIAEYDLFSRLDRIAEDRTAIFISHRLSSTKFCDRILVFDDGSIVEMGSHEELLASDGHYAQLFRSQAKYYKEKGVG